MTSLQDKTALVIGGSSGVGRATVRALRSEGVHVVAVARGAEALEALRGGEDAPVRTIAADATDASAAESLLRECKPELVVLAAGTQPRVARIDEQTWETFSAPWNADTQAAFHLVKSALTMPLSPGSVVVVVSSGAAIAGSPLSGGYAGAKRMQWLLAEYAQEISDQKKLGIRFIALIPAQLIEGTKIGSAAAAGYGALQGLSGAEFMKRRFAEPMGVDDVANAIVGCLRGDVAEDVGAVTVTGQGVKPLS